MSPGALRVLAFLHPAVALVTVVLVFHVATLGLRSRQRRGADARPVHARRAPWALALAWLAAATGVAATWLWRDDLEVAAGAHFWIGLAVVALLSTGAAVSRGLPASEHARRIHPALGLLALLLAGLQVFFGLPLLPF